MFRTSVTLIVVVSVLVGAMLGLILLEQTNTYDASAKKKSDKQKLREENQRLQDQIDAMKQIKSQNVILPNGSSVAFSQLPPETQRAMLNNSALINANIPAVHNDTSSHHTITHTSSNHDNDSGGHKKIVSRAKNALNNLRNTVNDLFPQAP